MNFLTKFMSVASVAAVCCASAYSQEESGLTGKIIINEAMQSCISGDVDLLMEIPDGWVELYNPGTKEISVKDWAIGKKLKYKNGYVLPDISIKAGGYLLIYCDNEDQVVTSGKKTEIHADFRMTNLKEGALYLYDSEKNMVDSLHLPSMPAPDIAYGRETDASDKLGYMLTPTPGAKNAGGLAKMILPDPRITFGSYLYSEGTSQRLKLSIPRGLPDDVTIHYTIDGTEPDTAQASLYSKAIFVSENTVLKAALFADSCITPPAMTRVYLFHDGKPTLPAISLSLPDEYLNDKKIGIIYANNENKRRGTHESKNRKDWRRPVQIDYFRNGGGAVMLSQGAEMRVSGAYSRDDNELKSFIVYADSRFGTGDYFSARFWPTTNSDQGKSRSIGLRDSGNDFGNSYMRDGASQIIFGYNTNLDWQGYQPTILYINGEYNGIINIRERANEDYVWAHYGGLEDVTVIETGELKKGDLQQWNEFVDFYSQDGHTYAEFDSVMDVEEFTNHMLANIFFSNTDFPANNNVAWRPLADGGRWRWILKDVDRSFGIWGTTYARAEFNTLSWMINMDKVGSETANSEYWTRLLRQLIKNDEYKQMFIDRYTVYLGDFLTYDYVCSILDWCRDQMDEEYPAFAKVYSINSYSSWLNQINNTMKPWAKDRPGQEYKHLQKMFSLGSIIPVTINNGVTSATYYDITVNDIPVSQHKFNGSLFSGREYRIASDYYDSMKAVVGWKVKETPKSGSSSTKTIMEPVLTYVPSSDLKSVAIDAILGENGVETVDLDNLEPESVTYFNAQGVASDTPFEGLNIIRYVYPDGVTHSEKRYF